MERLSCTAFVLLLAVSIPASAQSAGDECEFADGRSGQCTPLPYCRELYDLLQATPDRETFELLSRSNCGYQGKVPVVCCPQPRRQGNVYSPPATSSAPIADKPVDISLHPRIGLLPTNVCGIDFSDRIIGGNKTGIFEFPWMALLGYSNAGNRFAGFRCGGSLISKKYVLTAAHCISTDPKSLRLTTIRLGEHDLRTAVDCDDQDLPGLSVCAPAPQNFEIESALGHPLFTKDKLQNDIGLVRLKGEATFTETVSPICLPMGDEQLRNLEKTKLFVAGWGVTERGVISQELLKVVVPEIPIQRCAGVYRRNNVVIGVKQICAGADGRDSCAGDSGGPLMSYGEERDTVRWVQYGLVSFGPKQCATEGYPGVYTRLAYYMDWVLDNMQP